MCTRAADINKDDKTATSPLFAVISQGDLELLLFMINSGADVHYRGDKGNGALCHLILRTRLNQWPQAQTAPLIQTLLDAGADPAARNDDGKTASDLAQEFGFSELAALCS